MADAAPKNAVVLARPIAAGLPTRSRKPLGLGALTRRDAALDLMLVLLVGLAVPFGRDAAAALLAPELLEMGGDLAGYTSLLILSKLFDAGLLVGLTAYLVYRHRLLGSALGLRLDGLGFQVLWAGGTLAAVFLALVTSVVAVTMLILVFPSLEEDLKSRLDFLEMLPAGSVVSILFLMLPVAIHEELLFRTLMIPYLHRVGCPWIVAILVSTALFACLHITQGVLGVLQIFGVGLVLAVFFVLSRSTLAVIIAHYLFNVIQLILTTRLAHWFEDFGQRIPT